MRNQSFSAKNNLDTNCQVKYAADHQAQHFKLEPENQQGMAMGYMEWSRDLESGIPVIDTQHKRIIDFINELADACQTGNTAETEHVMEGLLNYTITHFEFEEALQEKAGYPFLKAHRRIHEIFMKKVADIRLRAAQGENVAQELLKLLNGWLISHIKGEDRDYIESVKTITDSKDREVSSWMDAALKKFIG